ncbi:type II toxin-antitoxin system RelE family toxin [Actinomyces oricola]|nr:type II toxin-antitoxin system RelE/ParE family toxin [Actinomyces oricola]
MAEEPRPHGARKLVGEQRAWRIRVGHYRVIYDILDAELTVTVVRTAHRREVYRCCAVAIMSSVDGCRPDC